MKKLIAIVMMLSMLIAVSCGGDGNTNSQPSSVSSDSTPVSSEPIRETVENNGVFTLNLDKDIVERLYSPEIKDNLLIFCYEIYPEYNESDDGYYEDVSPDARKLVLFDLEKNEIVTQSDLLEAPIEYVWGCYFTETGICVFDGDNGKRILFDMDLKRIGAEDYTYDDTYDVGKNSPFYTNQTSLNAEYSIFYAENALYTYFSEDMETVHIYPSEYRSVWDYCDNRLLTSVDMDKDTVFYIDDYTDKTVTNSHTFTAPEEFDGISSSTSVIGEDYAFICTSAYELDGENYEMAAYGWKYTAAPKNEALKIESYTYSALAAENDRLIAEIEKNYEGIDIELNSPCDDIWDMVDASGVANPIMVHRSLVGIEKYLSALPKGMLSEIYSGYEFWDEDFSKIRIDLVNDITFDENTLAFAQAWGEYMKLCFDINVFTDGDVAHEFMHLIDYRLEDYYNEDSMNDDWTNTYNADYFNDSWDYTEEFIFDENNFVSYYATTNSTEDRAETYEYLYTYRDSEKEPDYFEYEGIAKKFEGLCRLIRQAFPSVEAADEVFWENWVELE